MMNTPTKFLPHNISTTMERTQITPATNQLPAPKMPDFGSSSHVLKELATIKGGFIEADIELAKIHVTTSAGMFLTYLRQNIRSGSLEDKAKYWRYYAAYVTYRFFKLVLARRNASVGTPAEKLELYRAKVQDFKLEANHMAGIDDLSAPFYEGVLHASKDILMILDQLQAAADSEVMEHLKKLAAYSQDEETDLSSLNFEEGFHHNLRTSAGGFVTGLIAGENRSLEKGGED